MPSVITPKHNGMIYDIWMILWVAFGFYSSRYLAEMQADHYTFDARQIDIDF
jgi:hypothetical protein